MSVVIKGNKDEIFHAVCFTEVDINILFSQVNIGPCDRIHFRVVHGGLVILDLKKSDKYYNEVLSALLEKGLI